MRIGVLGMVLIWLSASGCERKLSPEELAVKEEHQRCVKTVVSAGGGLSSGNICDENAIRQRLGL